MSGRALQETAEAGDSDALLIFQNFGRMLGVAIAGYVNVFEPDRLTIGGGVSRQPLFFDHARSRRRPGAGAADAEPRVTIAMAEGGPDAGVIGAAVLAAQEVAAQNRDTAPSHATTTERAE